MNHQHSDVAIVGTETLYDLSAVKQSVITILKTQQGERLFRPEFGSRLEDLLWRTMDDDTASDIHAEIKRMLDWDTRAELESLQVTPDYRNNCYNIVIECKVNGIEDSIELQLNKKGL